MKHERDPHPLIMADLAARLRETLTEIDRHSGQSSARLLIDAVESTGGLETVDGGHPPVPVADNDWVDLAFVYFAACDELEVLPLIDGERKAWAR